ncbi:MAG: type II toxin-antitoxin system RelE/ParE family toxin [Terriglobia bacterium]
MPYLVYLRPRVVRDLKSLPEEVKERVEQSVGRLSENPRPHGSKKLAGFENEWRLRVGDYRVLYLINDESKQVVVARVAHRREAYRQQQKSSF